MASTAVTCVNRIPVDDRTSTIVAECCAADQLPLQGSRILTHLQQFPIIQRLYDCIERNVCQSNSAVQRNDRMLAFIKQQMQFKAEGRGQVLGQNHSHMAVR